MISILNTVGDKVVFLLAGLAVRSLSWSNRSILFLSFALLARGVERVQSNTRYQLGWAIVLLGVGTTEREWGDEEKVLYTKHSRERFFIVAHRERERVNKRVLSPTWKKKGTFFFIRSIINRCHWSCPLCLSHSMRHWSEATKKNLLIRSWRREPKKKFRFYISPLQPTNQPTNTMFFVLTLG